MDAPAEQNEETVLSSTRWLARECSNVDVNISIPGIKLAAPRLNEARKKGLFSLEAWKTNELNPKAENEASVDWIFLVDTLNFSFFSDSATLFTVAFNGKTYTGYWSLCAAINRALQEGIPITSATYMANVTLEQLRHVFRSETAEDVPLLEERVSVMNEAGRVLMEYFDGRFANAVRSAKGSARALLRIIVSHFSSYNDSVTYHNHKIMFYKRAQILIADLWACFRGQGLGEFNDIDTITMFADYRVPQCLVHLGVLHYSDALMQRLRDNPHLPPGHPLELQIRASSIWAVELLRLEMEKQEGSFSGSEDNIKEPLNAIVIDFYLWTYAKEHADDMHTIPIHKTRSIFY